MFAELDAILAQSAAVSDRAKAAYHELEATKNSLEGLQSKVSTTRDTVSVEIGRISDAMDTLDIQEAQAGAAVDMMFVSRTPNENGSGAPPTLAIAMLIKNPNIEALKTFIEYHAYLGFGRFDFFFDDTDHNGADTTACNDAAVDACAGCECNNFTNVVTHRCTVQWWQEQSKPHSRVWSQWAPHLHSDVIARQVLAIEVALRLNLEAGTNWLLHIDVDEALCFDMHGPQDGKGADENATAQDAHLQVCDSDSDEGGDQDEDQSAAGEIDIGRARAYFGSLPAQLDEITFLNHEAAPETSTVGNWFNEVTLFKANPYCSPDAEGSVDRFVAYTNGKSAVRVGEGVVPKVGGRRSGTNGIIRRASHDSTDDTSRANNVHTQPLQCPHNVPSLTAVLL
jgi:hypothetical protein